MTQQQPTPTAVQPIAQEAQQTTMTQPTPPVAPATPTTPQADPGIAAIIARAGHIDVKLPNPDGTDSGYAFRIAARSKQDPTERGNTHYTGGARWSVITPGNDTPSRSLPVEAAEHIAVHRETLAVVTEHVNRAALIGPYKPEKAQKASGTDPQATVDVAALASLTV